LASFTSGRPLTTEEAQAEARRFLGALADGRPIAESTRSARVRHRRALLLIGPEEERH
jgi:hypothetical protein